MILLNSAKLRLVFSMSHTVFLILTALSLKHLQEILYKLVTLNLISRLYENRLTLQKLMNLGEKVSFVYYQIVPTVRCLDLLCPNKSLRKILTIFSGELMNVLFSRHLHPIFTDYNKW